MFASLFSDPLPVGSPAPDFSLPDDAGNTVTLAGLRGRNVVLVFYPGDNTPVCTKQLCEFRDRWDKAAGQGVAVYGVSPQSQSSHGKFRARHSFPFPLLVDAGLKMAERYHASAALFVKRTVYVIGPDGTIRYARRGKPPVDEVLAAAR